MNLFLWLKKLFTTLSALKIHLPILSSLQETMPTPFSFNPNFTQEELACKCCGQWGMNDEFMRKLISLRWRCGFVFPITSAYRCEKEEERVGGKGVNHPRGRAVDISLSGIAVWKVIELAILYGFTGIGIKQHGDRSSRYLHLDDTHATLTFWTYA